MHLNERGGAVRDGAPSPSRTASEWLGLAEAQLSDVPAWVVEAIALRLTAADPEASLRAELRDRLFDSVAQLRQLARTDPLTGLANRRAVAERLADEILRANRYGRSLAVFLIDVDDLKRINDTFGHPAGDEVIQETARRVAAAVRATDLAGRWGGDEFAVVCPETDTGAATALGHKLRASVSSLPISVAGAHLEVTVSVGWGVDGVKGDAAALLATADASLYDAKRRRVRGI